MRLIIHQPGDETFTYEIPGYGTLHWNVTHAQRAVAAGQVEAHVTVDREQLAAIAAKNEWTQARVDQADPTIPGIGAPVIWQGQIIYILIDGTHRAVRAHQTGVPFEADLLTEAASRACLIAGVPGLIPGGFR